MMRKIWLPIFFLGNLFSTSTFSTTVHTFVQTLGVEYELPVNDPQIFSNIFFWTVKATCTIVSKTSTTPLSVSMLRKSGTVNDIELGFGDSMGISVQSGDKLNITAVSGAKVELVNRGTELVKASCATVQ